LSSSAQRRETDMEPFANVNWRVAKSLNVLLAEINRSAPKRSKEDDGSIGDASHASRTSDHNPCPCHLVVCARDFTHDPEGGFDAHEFADWLAGRLKTGQEGRVKYMISNSRICSGPNQPYRPGVWREYKGQNPHTAHVHVSVAHPSGLFDDMGPWEWELHVQRTESVHPCS
jgi:hypothetical protein